MLVRPWACSGNFGVGRAFGGVWCAARPGPLRAVARFVLAYSLFSLSPLPLTSTLALACLAGPSAKALGKRRAVASAPPSAVWQSDADDPRQISEYLRLQRLHETACRDRDLLEMAEAGDSVVQREGPVDGDSPRLVPVVLGPEPKRVRWAPLGHLAEVRSYVVPSDQHGVAGSICPRSHQSEGLALRLDSQPPLQPAAAVAVCEPCMEDSDSPVSTRAALVLFAGDSVAHSTVASELRGLGWRVEVIDTKQGGSAHDVLRPQLAALLLARCRRREFDAVFMAPPCSSFTPGHRPQLRSRRQPEGLTNAPQAWLAYIKKHNSLVAFAARVWRVCEAAAVPCMLENPADRGDPALECCYWPRFRDHGPMWRMEALRAAFRDTGAELVTFAQCQFGGDFQKYTTFAYSAQLAAFMTSFQGRECPASFPPGHPRHAACIHREQAWGRRADGTSRSESAAAYPQGLNREIAVVLHAWALSSQPAIRAHGDEPSSAGADAVPVVVGDQLQHGPALHPEVRELVSAAQVVPPRFASFRLMSPASADELLRSDLPGDLHRPVVPVKPKAAKAPRGSRLPEAGPPRLDGDSLTVQPTGPIHISQLFMPGVYEGEVLSWFSLADTACDACFRRLRGEAVEIPRVPTRVIRQDQQPAWARGCVWDCSDPLSCVVVRRSDAHTAFPGERQVNRSAVREVAQLLGWHDADIIRQVGGGGIESHSDCELATVLAFHHQGLLSELEAASKVVASHGDAQWVSEGTRHLPFVPCRLQPRNVVKQARLRVVGEGDTARVEEWMKPRVTTNLSFGAEQSYNAAVPLSERSLLLPTIQQYGLAAAILSRACAAPSRSRLRVRGYVVDADSAFSYCPIQVADLWAQCFVWWSADGSAVVRVDRRMGFGGAFAPQRFERFSTFVAAFVQHLQAAFDARHPYPEGVGSWSELRRRLQEDGTLSGSPDQAVPRYLQVFIDDFLGATLDDPVTPPPEVAHIVLAPEHTAAIGGVPSLPGTRVYVHAQLAVLGLARLGLVAAPHKVLVGSPIIGLGILVDFDALRLSCPAQKRTSMLLDVEAQLRCSQKDLVVECKRARALTGRFGNLSQVFPELLLTLHGGYRVGNASWVAKGRRVLPSSLRLTRSSAAHLQWEELLHAGREVLTLNEGVPLAPRRYSFGFGEEGVCTSATDASGTDGVGGFVFLPSHPDTVWLVSDAWPADIAAALAHGACRRSVRSERCAQAGGPIPTLSVAAVELFGSWAIPAAVMRSQGFVPRALVAIGDSDNAACGLNSASSGKPHMRELLRLARGVCTQILAVSVPRRLNSDPDVLSHPQRLPEAERAARGAGLTVASPRVSISRADFDHLRRVALTEGQFDFGNLCGAGGKRRRGE